MNSLSKYVKKKIKNLFLFIVRFFFYQVWGGKYGGATPDYQGRGTSVNYLLFDGANGIKGHTNKGGMYYVNAIEGSLACIEASAIGAKSVAKLVAKRLNWIQFPKSNKHQHTGDEL